MFRCMIFFIGCFCLNATAVEADAKPQVIELVKQLSNESFDIRERAAKQLEALGAAGIDDLRKASEKSEEPEARLRLSMIISRLSEREAVTKALRDLGNADWEMTKAALSAILRRRRDKNGVEQPLAEMAKGTDARARIAVEIQNHFLALSRFDNIKFDASTLTALQRHEKTMESALFERCRSMIGKGQ